MVYLANIGRVFGSSGSLEQAGGDGRWVFLDQLPEAGGEMSGSWIRSLAFFPQCQAELLGCPTGKKGGGVSYHSNLWRNQYRHAADKTSFYTHQLLFYYRYRYVYLAKRDIAAVLAMVTTLDMWGIFELVCTTPASPQPRAASSAACKRRKLIIKIQICNCTPAPSPKGAIITGITLGTSVGCVCLTRASRLRV